MPTRAFETAEPDFPREDETAPGPIDLLKFARNAVSRRTPLVLGVLLAGLSAAAGYCAIATPRYRAEARVLAQGQQEFASIARANVTEEHPMHAAKELIHRRDNLVNLIKRAGLLDASPKPGFVGQAWSDLIKLIGGSSSEEDPVEQLVLVLDKQLKVETNEATISIELDWPNRQQAYRIVEGALQNFLESRHVQEVTVLDEAIAILRGRAARLHAELDAATAEARQELASAAARSTPGIRIADPVPASAVAPRSEEDEELVRLKSMIEAKQRAIADVEDFRRHRLAELAAQYDSRHAIYSENHPDMVRLRLEIETLNGDSSQLSELRNEEKKLRAEWEALQASQPQPEAAPARVEAVPPVMADLNPGSIEQSERVRDARHRYEEVMNSLSQAQVDLDSARSAFIHRYTIIWPAQVPKKPVSPNLTKVLGLGGLASIILALSAAVLADWGSGKLLEPWQLEGQLGMRILGQVRRSS